MGQNSLFISSGGARFCAGETVVWLNKLEIVKSVEQESIDIYGHEFDYIVQFESGTSVRFHGLKEYNFTEQKVTELPGSDVSKGIGGSECAPYGPNGNVSPELPGFGGVREAPPDIQNSTSVCGGAIGDNKVILGDYKDYKYDHGDIKGDIPF